ncbi:MAG: GNAT family protein [Acidobacteriota bacterium]
MNVEPVVLEGEFVRLEPMRADHLPPLCEVGLDPALWKWVPTTIIDENAMSVYVHTAIEDQRKGVALPFVTRERSSGTIVGSTRFGNVDVHNLRAEIGWTWVSPTWQRTAINTEAKLLMLTHAFETWKCIRVELKTDALNEKSRNAILRLGAKEEGIFRKHVICDTGRFRDSVYYSIIDSEWEFVKADLTSKLAERR